MLACKTSESVPSPCRKQLLCRQPLSVPNFLEDYTRQGSGIVSKLPGMGAIIDRKYGRAAFGADPLNYHEARPQYPDQIYEILKDRCGLGTGSRTFEIGPGTGLASQKLLELGASPLILIEPDRRLATFLKSRLHTKAANLAIRNTSFEAIRLPAASFELGVAASSFHWMREGPMLRKVARLLCSGGWWAMWWHVFRDLSEPSAFQEATQEILGGLDRGPSWGDKGRVPFALATEERIDAMRRIGMFQKISARVIRWNIVCKTERLIRLYATFSPITRLQPGQRKTVLNGLREIAERKFGGALEVPISTPIYTAQRR